MCDLDYRKENNSRPIHQSNPYKMVAISPDLAQNFKVHSEGRLMFGFRKRKKYNGAVDTKLNNEYQISTDDAPGFPGVLAYLDLIDSAWSSGMSTDEAALYIATLYYCGLIKNEHYDDAKRLKERIDSIANFGISKRLISFDLWEKFSKFINNTEVEAGIKPGPR